MKRLIFLPLSALFALALFGFFVWLSVPVGVAAGVCAVPGTHPTIQAAVFDTGCTTINVAAGTFGETVSITRSVTIIGAGLTNTFVDGGAGGPIFYVSPGLSVTLESLTIQNGLHVEGTGLYNEGSHLRLFDTRFLDNVATSDGGGLYNLGGQVTILNSEFLTNTAFHGGGIYNTGVITVEQTLFQGNSAVNQTFTMGAGGGFYSIGSGRVERSMFVHNHAFATGGGVYNDGNLVVLQTSVNENFTQSGTGSGGGISNDDGLIVISSAIIGNNSVDGGGIINFGSMALINDTIGGNAGNGGGGLQNRNLATISYSTFSNNLALAGGGILMLGGTLNLNSSIVALSLNGGDCFISSGSLVSQDYNLDSDGTCNLTQPNDLPSTIPLFGTLGDNGGWTETQALLPGSPGIDGGDSATCPPGDQRGFPRPIGSACDMGAYEAGWVVYLPVVLKP
ncbi:MAG: choice-of-anchor Q domain-containing protein [Candidatus Promineifilaceae bacterium]